MSSTDDECKLPPHSREANKYPKHETYNKNIKNDTGEIYDAASLLNIIFCNPREFHSVCKPVGIRENFICTLNKKEISIALCRVDDNGAYIRKRTAKKIFKVAFEETKTKVISARICKVDASGSLYVNEREGAIYKKINIESDDVFEFFREYRESKANPNSTTLQRMSKSFQLRQYVTYVSLYYWKEGTATQNEDFSIPRHANAKKPTAAAYYRSDSQTISKARTMLSEKYSSSSIYNEVNHEAKISVGEEIRDPKRLRNLKQDLNKTKRESSSSSR